jgi:histidinol-phosphatase (PHP family)
MLTEKDGSYWPFDHRAYIEGWQERGEQQVWRRYFELWCDAIASKVPFAIMTHPDLPKKFGFKPKFDTRELYADVAKTAAMAGVMVEVNTNGLYKPVAEMYPSLDLLKAFADAGVPCTVSSDAHEPNNVARDIELAWALMREAGYREVTVPTRDGDRRAIPL